MTGTMARYQLSFSSQSSHPSSEENLLEQTPKSIKHFSLHDRRAVTRDSIYHTYYQVYPLISTHYNPLQVAMEQTNH